MDTNRVAAEILDKVGGKENVKDLTHCFTRLRFVLKDMSKVNKDVVEHLEGVIQVVVASGQFQVVLGAKVTKVYDAMLPMIDIAPEAESDAPQGNWFDRLLQLVSKIFTPIIPAIAAAGLIKGLLTAARLLMNEYGIDISKNDTYIIFFAASQVIFYFLPIFLGYMAAKAMKCNEIIAMMLGAFLCYPQIDAIVQNVGTETAIFGIPVIKASWTIGESTKVFGYTESVIPILLAVLVLAYVERALKRYVPQILQVIMVPGLSLLLMVPLTLCLLGPVGILVGNVIQTVYYGLMNFNAVLGGAIVGGLWGVLVIFGAHRALLPVGLNDIAVSGRQNLLAFAGAANFSQAGAALGVVLRTKSHEMKGISASAALTAALVGITEPAIYGCNLRLKKPMACAIACGAVGGGIMGLGGVYGDAFANNGVLTIFTYAAFGMTKFMFYLAGIALAFFGAAALTYVVGFEDIPDKQSLDGEAKNKSAKANGPAERDIFSPVSGKAIALTKVSDPVFASEALGKGIGVVPHEGKVYAPADGVVSLLYPTMHAIAITLDDATEVLLHIGFDTVKLEGKYFTKHVSEGDRVKQGDLLMAFDLEAMRAEGYDMTVATIITNTQDFASVEGLPAENVDTSMPVIHLRR